MLLALGVNPNNVWAVESEKRVYDAALASISKEGVPVKLHHGSLKGFFERVQETFDIAYLDTTGPLLGGKPLALAPVLELLRGARLEPLSVLITNFAEVPATEADRYANVMTDFFRFRYNEVPLFCTRPELTRPSRNSTRPTCVPVRALMWKRSIWTLLPGC